MSIVTYPLNDIMYSAEDAEIYNSTRTSGVYALENNLNYSITGAREITISPGMAWIKNDEFSGKAIAIKDPVVLQFAEPHSVLDRIDRVVLRFSLAENSSSVVVNKGVEASSPIPTERSTAADLYELVLYDISIPHGLVELTDANITDQRANPELCGLMTDGVSSLKNYLRFDLHQDISQEQQTQARTNIGAAAITQLVGENLLLNWDFRNPVNQRGISGTWGSGYGLDMWKSQGDSGATVNDGSLTLTTNQIQQSLEQYAADYIHNGEVHTASVMFEDGSVHSGQLTPTAAGDVSVDINGVTVKMANGGGGVGWKWFCLKAVTGTKTIKAVKLELGSVSTLAMDRCMDYGAELLKCQRYFVRYGGVANANAHIGWGMSPSATGANCIISLPCKMRINAPTISITGTGSVALRYGATDSEVSEASTYVQIANVLYFGMTSSGLTSSRMYTIRLQNGACLDISAEM